MEVRERPLSSPLVRVQARENEPTTNLIQKRVEVDDSQGSLLTLLDGTRTRDELLGRLGTRCSCDAGALWQRRGIPHLIRRTCGSVLTDDWTTTWICSPAACCCGSETMQRPSSGLRPPSPPRGRKGGNVADILAEGQARRSLELG
jgi:hypothetical protein